LVWVRCGPSVTVWGPTSPAAVPMALSRGGLNLRQGTRRMTTHRRGSRTRGGAHAPVDPCSTTPPRTSGEGRLGEVHVPPPSPFLSFSSAVHLWTSVVSSSRGPPPQAVAACRPDMVPFPASVSTAVCQDTRVRSGMRRKSASTASGSPQEAVPGAGGWAICGASWSRAKAFHYLCRNCCPQPAPRVVLEGMEVGAGAGQWTGGACWSWRGFSLNRCGGPGG
jgi:hypothetical protein